MNDLEPTNERLNAVLDLLTEDERRQVASALERVVKDENRNSAFVQLANSHMNHMRVLQHSQPKAYAVLMGLIQCMNKTNAIMLDHDQIAELTFCSVSTVKRAVAYLEKNNWIEIHKHGTSRYYVINSRIAWKSTPRGRQAVFNATIVLSADENTLLTQAYRAKLKHIPIIEKPHTAQTLILRDSDTEQEELDV